MTIAVKICGLSTPEAVAAAVEGGADMVGFVFFDASPRAVSPEEARILGEAVPDGVEKVGLLVDPDDGAVRAAKVAGMDVLQLHGRETPERVTEVKRLTSLPVMKACAISLSRDVAAARAYESVADRLLFDARPPKGSTRPGGNAAAFDWDLLKGTDWSKPWLLAGGLNPENVRQALAASGAAGVDVSSGVETAPGLKSAEKISAFLSAARG